jgi:diguanylate cyclase (GGDEF)-like protein/PAS domain S-box-containing protein
VDRGTPTDDPAELRRQLRLASASAQEAYRDTTRLIRLLTILGHPSAPEDLVDETLRALSEVFQADVTCLARLVDGRMVVTASCGLPEDDPAFVAGWTPSPAAIGVADGGSAFSHTFADDDRPGDDEAATARRLGLLSGAWLPLPDERNGVTHLLVLYRRQAEPFTATELALLGSVAHRLLLSIQARRRAVALELLARSGHVLPQHREVPPLLEDAGRLLRDLVGADCAVVFDVTAGRARRCARSPDGDPSGLFSGPPWDLGEVPLTELPGWHDVLDGRPRLVAVERPEGPRQVLVTPAGVPGAPASVLYAGWADLPPLMSTATESAVIFATHLSAALANVSLYRALSASEASLRLITDSVSDLIAVVDPSCRFVYASAAYARAVAHAPEALMGRSMLDLVDAEDRVRLRDALLTSIASTASVTVEYRFRTGDGVSTWVESVVRAAETADRNVVMSTRLIEDRRRREDELRRRAAQDSLTDLANRAGVTLRLEEALASAAPGEVGLLFCDLDKFKQVNDRLGHAAGDSLLQQVAERLRRCARAGDLVGRLGGDEFVFVLDGVSTAAEVSEIGRRVTTSLRSPFPVGGELLTVSASVGAAIGSRGQASAPGLLDSADAAMYAAKRRSVGVCQESVTRVTA